MRCVGKKTLFLEVNTRIPHPLAQSQERLIKIIGYLVKKRMNAMVFEMQKISLQLELIHRKFMKKSFFIYALYALSLYGSYHLGKSFFENIGVIKNGNEFEVNRLRKIIRSLIEENNFYLVNICWNKGFYPSQKMG